MSVIQTIVVDMSTRGLNPVAYSHQNDDFRTFHFEMKNNGEDVDLTGWSCKIGAILPGNDGGYRVIAGEEMADAIIDENVVSATLGSPYTDKAGNGVLTLIFTTPLDYTIRPINVDFRIQESADGEDVIAGASDFVPVLEQYMSESMAQYIDAWLDDHPEATTTVQDGSLTFEKFANDTLLWVTPEMFGAVGDGVTDDTDALQTAIDNGNVVLRGAYLVSSDLNLNGKILGYGGTIILSACHMVYENSCNLEGVSIISDGNVNTCVRFDSGTYCENVNIKNCAFYNLNSTDTTRQNIGIRARGKNVNIENVSFSGYVSGIIYEPYQSVKNGVLNINSVTGENIQTLIDLEGWSTNVINSPVVKNIKLINTASQKSSIATEVGSDAVLVNYCNNLIIAGIVAINPRERAIYANHIRDGIISDVYCYGSQVVKVCGTAEYFAERIKVNNITGEEINDNGYLFTTYYSRDVTVNNANEHTTSDLNNVQMIRLQDSCENITIDGFTLDGATRGAISLEKTEDDAAQSNIIIRNGVIKNCNMRVQNNAVMLSDTTTQNATWITGLIVENVSLNPDDGLIGTTNAFINLVNIANVLLKDNFIRGVVASSLLTLGIVKGSNVNTLKLVGTFPIATRDSFTSMTFTADSNVRTQNHGGSNNFDGILTSDGNNNNAIVEGTINLTSSLTQILDSDAGSYPYIEINGNGGYGKWMLFNNTVTTIGTASGITVDRYGRISATTSGKYYIKFIR